MEAKNESTLHFANKTGDKLLIEISITGNPDEVVNKIVKALRTNEDLFEGAKCEQLFFKGRTIEHVINTAKIKAIEAINDSLAEIENQIKLD